MLSGALPIVLRIVSYLRPSFPPLHEELIPLLCGLGLSWLLMEPLTDISGVLPACGGFLPEFHMLQSLLLTSSSTTIPSTQPDPGPPCCGHWCSNSPQVSRCCDKSDHILFVTPRTQSLCGLCFNLLYLFAFCFVFFLFVSEKETELKNKAQAGLELVTLPQPTGTLSLQVCVTIPEGYFCSVG